MVKSHLIFPLHKRSQFPRELASSLIALKRFECCFNDADDVMLVTLETFLASELSLVMPFQYRQMLLNIVEYCGIATDSFKGYEIA